MAAMTFFIPPFSGWMVGHHGAQNSSRDWRARHPRRAACADARECGHSVYALFLAYAVFGVGFGFVNAPITSAAVSGMPRAQAGVASAIASTSRQIGATLGVAVVGALVSSKFGLSSARLRHRR